MIIIFKEKKIGRKRKKIIKVFILKEGVKDKEKGNGKGKYVRIKLENSIVC